jgi:gas vesicle protein
MTAALWFLTGAFIGALIGFFAAVLCMAARAGNFDAQAKPDPVDEED